MNEQQAVNRPLLRLLCVITNWDHSDNLSALFHNAGVRMHYRCHAEGTANSEILDYLGLGSTDKAVILGLAAKQVAYDLLGDIALEFQLNKAGRGVAFTLPLSGVSNPIMQLLDKEVRERLKPQLEQMQQRIESDIERMKSEVTHSLIIAMINQGYSEELMNAARTAGATGGTVIHARRIGQDDSMQFLGISVQAEKEIVAILTEKQNKVDIMKAVCAKCGLASEAQGIVFALPVDSVAGLSAANPNPNAPRHECGEE